MHKSQNLSQNVQVMEIFVPRQSLACLPKQIYRLPAQDILHYAASNLFLAHG
jgi:hypothetical protein